MTALADLVDPLKRDLAVPGTYDDVFPDTGDDDLEASLADGFGEARLQGFFPTLTLTEVNGTFTSDPDLTAAGQALVIIFTSMRILRAQLRNMLSSEKYAAKGAEFEVQRPANLLRDELAYLDERLNKLITQAQRTANTVTVAVFDNYTTRTAVSLGLLGGFAPYELPVAGYATLGW